MCGRSFTVFNKFSLILYFFNKRTIAIFLNRPPVRRRGTAIGRLEFFRISDPFCKIVLRQSSSPTDDFSLPSAFQIRTQIINQFEIKLLRYISYHSSSIFCNSSIKIRFFFIQFDSNQVYRARVFSTSFLILRICWISSSFFHFLSIWRVEATRKQFRDDYCSSTHMGTR